MYNTTHPPTHPPLGDADWNIVFRYLPIPTAQIYWHRIQERNLVRPPPPSPSPSHLIQTASFSSFQPVTHPPTHPPQVLNKEEIEAIGGYVKGLVGSTEKEKKKKKKKGGGWVGGFAASLGRWVRGGHWSLTPGSKYEELPPRLRNR